MSQRRGLGHRQHQTASLAGISRAWLNAVWTCLISASRSIGCHWVNISYCMWAQLRCVVWRWFMKYEQTEGLWRAFTAHRLFKKNAQGSAIPGWSRTIVQSTRPSVGLVSILRPQKVLCSMNPSILVSRGTSACVLSNIFKVCAFMMKCVWCLPTFSLTVEYLSVLLEISSFG